MRINETDGRGSEGQIRIFEMMKRIYPRFTNIWEQEINEIDGRFDMLVKELGIAVEVDGIQHNKYTEFFHKDPSGLKQGWLKDKAKDTFCAENGIKLLRLDYKKSLKIEESELKKLIDETPYPEGTYTYECVK